MSAEPNFTETEYELLSAYLDGELADDERAALELRLAADAALRAELNALRRTAELVKALPRLKAPRSFALTPAMIGQTKPAHPQPSIVELTRVQEQKRRRPNRVPLYALASAAALLVLVVGVLSLLGPSIGNTLSNVLQGLAIGDGQAAEQVAAGVTQTPSPMTDDGIAASGLPQATPTFDQQTPAAFVPVTAQPLPMATAAPNEVSLTATSLALTFLPPQTGQQVTASAFMATQAPPSSVDGLPGSGGVGDGADNSANAALTATFDAEAQRSVGGAAAQPTARFTATTTPVFAAPPPTATLMRAPDEADPDQVDEEQEEAPQPAPTESAGEAETGIMLAQEASPTAQASPAEPFAEEPSLQAEATQAADRPPVDAISAPPEAMLLTPAVTAVDADQTTADTAQQSVLQTPSATPAATATVARESADGADEARAAFLGIEPAFWLVLLIAALLLAVGVTFWFLGRRAR